MAITTSNPSATSSTPTTLAPAGSGNNQTFQSPAAQTYIQNQLASSNAPQIASIKSQIADKTAQVNALNSAGVNDTNDITKNSDGSYSLNSTGQQDQYNTQQSNLNTMMQNYVNSLLPTSTGNTTVANDTTAYNNFINSENLGIADVGQANPNVVKPLAVGQGQQALLKAQNAPIAAQLQDQIKTDTATNTQNQNAALAAIKNGTTLLGQLPGSPANLKAAADLQSTLATTQKTLSDLDPNSPANQLIQSEIAKNYSDIAQTNNFDGTGLSSKQASDLQALQSKINSDKQTVNLQNVATADGILSGLSGATNSSDQAAVLMSFVQSLQPGASTVRAAIGPITAMLGSKGYQSLLKAEQIVGNNGTIPPDVMQSITSTADNVYKSRLATYKSYLQNNYITPNITNLGIPDLATRLGSFTQPNSSTSTSNTNTKSQPQFQGYTLGADGLYYPSTQ